MTAGFEGQSTPDERGRVVGVGVHDAAKLRGRAVRVVTSQGEVGLRGLGLNE